MAAQGGDELNVRAGDRGRAARATHAVLVAVLGIGFVRALAHRSEDPLLFGRYSLAYVVVLLGWLAAWVLVILLGVDSFQSWLKRHSGRVRAIGVLLMLLALAEIATRSVLGLVADSRFFWHGREHFLILVRHATRGAEKASYHSYPPYYQIPGSEGRVKINRLGFRGRDVGVEKPAGTLRIETLGESSTFGRNAREGWTYPDQLERKLGERLSGGRVEVVSLATPHNNSTSLVALFRGEGLRFKPDIVVLYAGANDAVFSDAALRSRLYQQWHGLSEFADRFSLVKHVLAPSVGKLLGITPFYSEAFLHAVTATATGRFIANVGELRRLCEEKAVRLVLVTQQVSSGAEPNEIGDLRSGTYEQEFAKLSELLKTRGGLTWKFGAIFYIHAHIMKELRSYAAAHDVLLVDGIEALNPSRSKNMVNWAELSEEGNGVLAAAIAERLAPSLQYPASAGSAARAER